MADDPALNNTHPYSRGRGNLLLPRGSDAEALHRRELEEARRALIERQRSYASGTQYAEFNKDRLSSLCRDQEIRTLPEHERVHAYATQIGESVSYLVSRLGAGFSLRARSAQVQAVIDEMIESTDALASVDENGEITASTDATLHDAIVAGDVPVLVGWDDLEDRVVLQFWESEAVEFVDDQRGGIREVVLTYTVWVAGPQGGNVEKERQRVYSLEVSPAGVEEAVVRVYEANVGSVVRDTDPISTTWLGVGRIPWALLRADRRGLRSFRGSSLVTTQVMETADRFNSVEQTGFIISRYNSHSNIAVSGDEVMAQSLSGKHLIRKDVADVIPFPANTDVTVLSLPTDPAMIEHQRAVLTDALYSAFGLVRMDPSAIEGLGAVSGYALEIMNGRTDATFGRVARSWRKDWAALLDLILDVTAWRSEGQAVFVGVAEDTFGQIIDAGYDPSDPEAVLPETPEGYRLMHNWWDTDPGSVFPERSVAIGLGTGAVVDDVKGRDDYKSGLVSRAEALRQRGKTPEQIGAIETEIAAEEAGPGANTEAGAIGDTTSPSTGTVGGTLGNAERTTN